MATSVEDYAERLNLDPEQMRQVEERYNLVKTLKRKYGGSLQEVITFGEKAAKRLADLEGRDEALAKLNSELGELDETIQELGQALSEARKAVAPKLVTKPNASTTSVSSVTI